FQTADAQVPNLRRIAKYATATSTWTALAHNGLSATVQALAVVGTDLYVGGSFTQSGDFQLSNLTNIAKYATATNTWAALAHNGLNAGVSAVAVIGTDLYAGGTFSATRDSVVTNLNRIADFGLASLATATPTATNTPTN